MGLSLAFHEANDPLWPVAVRYIKEHEIGQPATLPKGQALYRQNEFAQYVYFILSGKLQILHLTQDGRQFIQRIFSEDSIIGLVPLLLEEVHMSTGLAMTDVCYIQIDLQQFQSLTEQQPQFNQMFMRSLAASVRYYSWTSRILSDSGIRERMLDCLKRIAFEYGAVGEDGSILLDMALTQSDLSEMICCSRQNLSLQFGLLKKNGVIAMEGRKIRILKPWF